MEADFFADFSLAILGCVVVGKGVLGRVVGLREEKEKREEKEEEEKRLERMRMQWVMYRLEMSCHGRACSSLWGPKLMFM